MFEAQLACLRDEGFVAIGPAELDAFLRLDAPLPERPVMLTFDDGYVDFAEHAWPLLKRYGFEASVFIVPAKVGGCADWDEASGEAAPLMDWDTLRALASEGLDLQSHSHTHPPLTTLGVGELYREAEESAEAMERELGRRPTVFCYPYGAHDVVVQRVMEECGYRLALTTEPGCCHLGAAPVRVPRVEVAGHDDLQTFRRKVGL
jgi:peptidoglycan/xylan/chitin deacetylase (PgdA/CDA1 family)